MEGDIAKRMQSPKKSLGKGILLFAGSSLYALALNLFLVRNHIAPGGFSGVATVFNYLFAWPVGLVVFLSNLPLFLLAWRRLGAEFCLLSLLSTGIMSIMIDATAYLPLFTQDRLMASIYGGVLSGAGIGLLLIAGATSGGSDLLGRLLLEGFPSISIGKLIAIIDGAVILFAALVYRNIESALYAIITIYITSRLTDVIVNGFSYEKIAYIVTERPKEVTDAIFSQLHRGVTLLQAKGMYTQKDKSVLMVVIKKNQTVALKNIIRQIDSQAFVIMSEAVEVLGLGFRTG
jgi:uncharacterized membrane-anchored protein YitT (DUF2179 family)